jgi:chromosome segregation ATPase
VNEIRKTLASRFQEKEEQLSSSQETIDRLETENQALTETVSTLQTEITSLSTENTTLSEQLSSLRRNITSFQSKESEFEKERTRWETRRRHLEMEVDSLRLAVQNWERTANEEHGLAENSRDRIVLLEEEIASYKDHQYEARMEAERYRDESEKWRGALRDVQEERKRELREVVEGMEGQIERLNVKVEQAEKRAATAEVPYLDP